MAGEVETRRLTLQEYYKLPDDGLKHELQAGFLVAEPQPNARHGIVVARLVALLSNHVLDTGSGAVFGESGFLLATDPVTLRGPDVAFVAQERLAAAGDLTSAFPGAPDLAIEVVSPPTPARESAPRWPSTWPREATWSRSSTRILERSPRTPTS